MDLATIIAIDTLGEFSVRKKFLFLQHIRKRGILLDTLSASTVQQMLKLSKPPENPTTALRRAQAIIAAAESAGVSIVPYEDLRYPALLREIYDPPFLLYVQGEIPEHPMCGVVGSRRVPEDGATSAFAVGLELALSRVP